jgi:hypothetical protein
MAVDDPGVSGPEVLRSLSTLEETERRAFQRGREAEHVDARLAEHDRHLAAINGSIERLASSQEEMTRLQLRAVAAQETRDKDAAQQREKLTAAATQSFSRKQVWIGGAGVAAMVAAAVLTATGHL